jgi:magnesium transporter
MPSNRGSAGETSSHDSQRRQDSHDLPLPTPLTPGQTRGRAPPTTSVSTATAAMAPSGLAAVTIPDDPSPRTLPDDLQQSTQAGPAVSDGGKKKKKNRHRKRRNRRQSFLAPEGSGGPVPEVTNRSSEHISRASPEQHPNHAPFYRGRNLSSTSLESEALLDHR